VSRLTKAQRHPIVVEQNPDMIGANRGPPRVVLSYNMLVVAPTCPHDIEFTHTTMKYDKARPLGTGSSYISAICPLTMAIGELPNMPQSSRKTRKLGKLGARAQPNVHTLNKKKVATVRFRRPMCSLSGPPVSEGKLLAC